MKFKKGTLVINKHNGLVGYYMTYHERTKSFGLYSTPEESIIYCIGNYYEREFKKASKKNVRKILKKLKEEV